MRGNKWKTGTKPRREEGQIYQSAAPNGQAVTKQITKKIPSRRRRTDRYAAATEAAVFVSCYWLLVANRLILFEKAI